MDLRCCCGFFRSLERSSGSTVKTGGDHCHADLILKGIIKGCTEDDVGIGMCCFLYEGCSCFHIFQTHLLRAGDVDQYAPCALPLPEERPTPI